MKTRLSILTLLLSVLFFLQGCMTNQKGTVFPGNDLSVIKKFYVVHLPADSRGVEKLIANELAARGFEVTSGEAINAPADVDAIVTYKDKWMWDIKMYMLQLDIEFRKPVSETPIASGSSMRTSLARKSPENMVKEVLDQIFKKQ